MTCRTNLEAVANFEQGLFAPFQEILQQDVQGWFIFQHIYFSKSNKQASESLGNIYLDLSKKIEANTSEFCEILE